MSQPMDNTLKNIAKNLREWTDTSGLTQSAVAKKAKVSPVYVNQLLNEGNSNPGIAQLTRIASVFNRSLVELIAGNLGGPGHGTRDCLRVAKQFFSDLDAGNLDSALVKDALKKR